MSRIEEFFEKAVAAGYIPQIPMNYDTVAYKIYTTYLENKTDELTTENAELRARLDRAVELPCKLGGCVYSVRWSKDNPKDGIVVEECVSRIEVDSSSGFVIHTIEYGSLPSFNIYYDVDWNDTVFATRAEAEARLKELQGGRI